MSRVLVLEDDEDLRDVLSRLMCATGRVSCVTASSFDEMVAHENDVLDCDVALLDVNLGPDVPSGVDAYHWLRTHQFHGRIWFLTGHARSNPLVQQATAVSGAGVIEKPVDPGTILKLVDGA